MDRLALTIFLLVQIWVSSSVFIVQPSTNVVVEPFEEPIVHNDKLIHAIVPVPEGFNPGDIIVTMRELENADKKFSVQVSMFLFYSAVTYEKANKLQLFVFCPWQDNFSGCYLRVRSGSYP